MAETKTAPEETPTPVAGAEQVPEGTAAPTGEEEPPEPIEPGKGEPTEPAPPWGAQFAEVADGEALLGHEALTETLKARDEESEVRQYDLAKSHLQESHNRQLQTTAQQAEASTAVGQLARSMEALTANLNEVSLAGGATVAEVKEARALAFDQLSTVLNSNPEWAKVFNDARYNMGLGEGKGKVWNGLRAQLPAKAQQDVDIALGKLNDRLNRGAIDLDAYTVESSKLMSKALSDGAITSHSKELDKKAREVAKAEAAAKAREEKGPHAVVPSGGGGGGGGSYRTKAEARTLHVQNKISSNEMRRVNADPSIPES